MTDSSDKPPTKKPDEIAPSKASLALLCIALWFAATLFSGPVGIWLAIGSASIALGAAVLGFDRANTRALLTPTPKLILVGLVAGSVMSAATYLLYPILARVAPFIAVDATLLYAVFRGPSPLLAALTLVPVIFGEELVWRGITQSVFVRSLGAVGGVVLASLIYALVLAPLGSLLLVLVALGCGLVWGGLRAVTGSLVPSLVAHLLWDALVLLIVPLDLR